MVVVVVVADFVSPEPVPFLTRQLVQWLRDNETPNSSIKKSGVKCRNSASMKQTQHVRNPETSSADAQAAGTYIFHSETGDIFALFSMTNS